MVKWTFLCSLISLQLFFRGDTLSPIEIVHFPWELELFLNNFNSLGLDYAVQFFALKVWKAGWDIFLMIHIILHRLTVQTLGRIFK